MGLLDSFRGQRHNDRWNRSGQVVRNGQLVGRRSLTQWGADTARSAVSQARFKYRQAQAQDEFKRYGRTLTNAERRKSYFYRARNIVEDQIHPRNRRGIIPQSRRPRRRGNYVYRRTYGYDRPRKRYNRGRSYNTSFW